MKRVYFLLILLVLTLNLPLAFAEDMNLDEIVVTESKFPQSTQEVTHKIDVVDQREIENTNLVNRNLAEAIRYTPGNFVNPLSRNDANWGSYGSLSPKYNSWLLDGLPIDPFVDPMSLESIYLDRMEVHRGPASVLYPNYMTMDFAGNITSLAGITNLITKEKIQKSMSKVSLGYGNWNTLNGSFYHEGNAEPFHFFLGANYEKSDYTNYGTNPSWLNMLDDPNYQKFKGFLKTTYFVNPQSKLSLFVHHTKHDGDAGRPNRDYDHQYDLVNLIYSLAISSDLSLDIKGGYRYYNRTWEEDNYPTDLGLKSEDGVRQHILPFDIVLNYKHLGKGLLTLGIDGQASKYQTRSENNLGLKTIGNDVKANNLGIYLQDKVVLNNWVLRAGGRYNRTKHTYDILSGIEPSVDSKSWDEFTWSAGVRYNLSDRFGVYLNGGSSFLVPSAKSVGGTLTPPYTGNGQLPNPSLKPERGYSFDIGADMWVTSNLFFGMRGFYHILKDSIVTNVVSLNPSQSMDINAGKSYIRGLELEAKHVIDNRFTYFANLTYNSTKIENNLDLNQDGSDIPFVPEFIFNAGLTAQLPYSLTVSPYFQYVGKYYDSSDKTGRRDFGKHGIVNMVLNKGLAKGDKFTSNLKIELNNLFNKKYEMPWQFQDPGFSAMAKLELYF